MTRYRKKPGVVKAEQYDPFSKVPNGMCRSRPCFDAGNDLPHVHTIHNNQIALIEVGDWIIPEPDGLHFYPCKPDIFNKTYERVED